MTDHATTVLAEGLAFPEGPRWRDGVLWFSDVRAHTVNRLSLDGAREVVARFDDSPSGIGFLPDGTPLVALMRTKQVVRIVGDGSEVHADLRDLPGDFLNDMLVDEDGRAYVGVRATLAPDVGPLPRTLAQDSLAAVQPDGSVGIAAAGVLSPNGMVLRPGGGALLMAEIYAQRIVEFTRHADGSLGDLRVFADVPGRFPDGICLDAAGSVWAGSPYTDEFLRIAEGGEIQETIPVPGGVACTFGGPDRDLLFLLGVDPAALTVPGSGRPSGSSGPRPPFTNGRIATTRPASPGAGWQ